MPHLAQIRKLVAQTCCLRVLVQKLSDARRQGIGRVLVEQRAHQFMRESAGAYERCTSYGLALCDTQTRETTGKRGVIPDLIWQARHPQDLR